MESGLCSCRVSAEKWHARGSLYITSRYKVVRRDSETLAVWTCRGQNAEQTRIFQQFTYGSLAQGVLICPKVYGNSAESLRKFAKTSCCCVRKGCGDSAESFGNFAEICGNIFCNDPFPNDPIIEVLNCEERGGVGRG